MSTAVGGMNVMWTVEGRERYPVNLRYPRQVRDSVDKLLDLPIVTASQEVYLDEAVKRRRPATLQELRAAVIEGAVQRVRPKAMTAAVIIAGLLPIMLVSGTGSEVMRRITAPLVGGMVTAPLVSMLLTRSFICGGKDAG